jgi:hypothetical protein
MWTAGDVCRMHVQTGDVESIWRRKVDEVVKSPILLLAGSISRGGRATTRSSGANCNIPKSQPRLEILTSYPPLLYPPSLNSTLRTPYHVHTLEIIRAPHIDYISHSRPLRKYFGLKGKRNKNRKRNRKELELEKEKENSPLPRLDRIPAQPAPRARAPLLSPRPRRPSSARHSLSLTSGPRPSAPRPPPSRAASSRWQPGPACQLRPSRPSLTGASAAEPPLASSPRH